MQIGRADGAVVGSRTSSLLLTVGYTFRSRSPRPGRPAVPHHAACRGCSHQYRRSRLRLPPSPPRRYDDEAMDGLSPPYGHQRLVAHRNRYTSPSLLALSPSRGIVPRYGWADHLVGRADAATPRTRLRRLGRSARRHVEQHHHQAISSATTVGFFGLLAALHSGIGWMANLRDALSAPWGNAPTRPPIVRLVRAAPFGARVGCHVRGHWAAVRVGLSGAGVPRARRADGGAEALVTPLGVLIGLATNWLIRTWVIVRLPRAQVALHSTARAAVLGAVGFTHRPVFRSRRGWPPPPRPAVHGGLGRGWAATNRARACVF